MFRDMVIVILIGMCVVFYAAILSLDGRTDKLEHRQFIVVQPTPVSPMWFPTPGYKI